MLILFLIVCLSLCEKMTTMTALHYLFCYFFPAGGGTTTTTRHFASWEQTTTHFPPSNQNRDSSSRSAVAASSLHGSGGGGIGHHNHPLLAASASLNSPVIRPIPNRLASPPESKISVSPHHILPSSAVKLGKLVNSRLL